MEYIGIRTTSKESAKRFCNRAEKRGAELQTVSRETSFVGIAVDGNVSSFQVAVRDGVLCAVDGRIRLGGQSQVGSNGRPSSNEATRLLEAWKRRKLGGLRDTDLTASATLWDADSNRLVLARAQNGIPPIFFAETRDALLWTNSIKTLLRYGVEAELNRLAVDAYFGMGYIPSPWTLLKGVQKVPAGRLLDYTPEGRDVKKHRDPVPKTRNVGNLDDSAEELKRRLCRSLDQMVDGHDRVGVLLSSGVDSSLLVGLLHCELGVPVEAFTFDYTGYEGPFDERFNEYDRARRLTREYDIPHHKIEYGPDWLRSNLASAVRQYEEPFTFGIHTAPLDAVAERGIQLLINGVAGNECISPAANYALRLDGPLVENAARTGSALLQTWPFNNLSETLNYWLDFIGSPASKIFLDRTYNSFQSRETRKRLFNDSSLPERGREAVLKLFEKEVRQTGLSRKVEQVSHLKNTFFISDHALWWNYRWAHTNGLEMGAPFTTPTVRSWMQSLRQPLWHPYQESIMKVLTRRAAATLMPDEIASHQRIAQTSPLLRWLDEGRLDTLLDKYLSMCPGKEGIADISVGEKKSEELSGPWLVWNALCYMVWKVEFFRVNWTIEASVQSEISVSETGE